MSQTGVVMGAAGALGSAIVRKFAADEKPGRIDPAEKKESPSHCPGLGLGSSRVKDHVDELLAHLSARR